MNLKKRVKWQSPSNIALVKYWGKKGVQIGINPSVSFSLNKSYTETEIVYTEKQQKDLSLKFYFEGERNPAFEERVLNYCRNIYDDLELFQKYHLEINSRNTFPHSAGIASSASAMSSLALVLTDIERAMGNITESDFKVKASHFARLASGSAARSVYGGFSLWGRFEGITESADEYAIALKDGIHPDFMKLNDAILLVHTGIKTVSSSAGHRLMNDHPYKEVRINQANEHCRILLDALKSGNFSAFIDVCESEALSLHALMMNSTPSFILMQPNTLELIRKIREFRNKTGCNLCFTLDAGPNIHLLYPDKEKDIVHRFIHDNLAVYCSGQKWIDDKMGSGPQKIS